jgi:SanA protein
MGFFKKIVFTLLMGILLYALIVRNNNQMAEDASPYIYSDISKVPAKKALLLLGTSKYLKNGHINYFYKYRIDSAVKLFKRGKVKAIVVSGDNGDRYYDEPTTMRNDLVARGVPSRYITLDYAGFRTLDSVVRAKAIFDLDDYIIVSQRFHLERAIYIAHAKGEKVIGFVAKDFKNTVWAKRMAHRELLARAKAFLDVHLFDTEPKFYGSKVEVVYKP